MRPKTKNIVVITNELDDSVNEKILDRVADDWQKQSSVKITRFEFDKSLRCSARSYRPPTALSEDRSSLSQTY